jgi:hypothetical protein
MEPKSNATVIDLEQKVFDIKNEPLHRGAWWWWFWLFFFNNPKNPATPQQLMILWSTKNVSEIECNNLTMRLNHPIDKSNLDGAVAAWYFDGETMHHNFLLEQCRIQVSDRGLSSDSRTPTWFSINKTENTVKIGDDFEFIAKAGNHHDFSTPSYRSHTYLGNKGYSIIRLNHLDLRGQLKNNPIQGSAYFQRVFVTAPAIPWYWGIFHFENGGVLTYFNPHLLGQSVKKEISFFDGNKLHEFTDIAIKLTVSGENIPTFTVSGENEHETITFIVNSYSHSSWTFRRRVLGIISNNLIYNEYPAVISDLKLANQQTGETIISEDLGKSVGNAEHTTGVLL